MALDVPVNTPLTDNQALLLSQISTMTNILSLPSINFRTIPKSQQISTYDYLVAVLDVLGVSLEPILFKFIDNVVGSGTTFLEKTVTNGVADSLAQSGVQISPFVDNNKATPAQKQAYQASNRGFVDNLLSTVMGAFMAVIKQQIAKDLTLMLFGGPTGPTATNPNAAMSTMILNPDSSVVNTLVQNAVCAEGLFSISNTPSVTDQQLSYNRVALKQQLAAGTVTYVISCQSVKISLPQNPAFIFNGGGQFSTSSTGQPTPSQSLSFLCQYVNNQVQNINNETNAQKGGNTFQQNMVEKMINYMSILVQTSVINPTYLVPAVKLVFDAINASLPASQQLNSTAYVYSNCDIASDPTNKSKSAFAQSIFNAMYAQLIDLLLLAAIQYFKPLVIKYFAKMELERNQRRLANAQQDSPTASSQLSAKNAIKVLNKIQQYEAAIAKLDPILKMAGITITL